MQVSSACEGGGQDQHFLWHTLTTLARWCRISRIRKLPRLRYLPRTHRTPRHSCRHRGKPLAPATASDQLNQLTGPREWTLLQASLLNQPPRHGLWQRIQRLLTGLGDGVVSVTLQIPLDSGVYVRCLGRSLVADLRRCMPSVAGTRAAVRHSPGLATIGEEVTKPFTGTLSRLAGIEPDRRFVGHIADITLAFLVTLVPSPPEPGMRAG
jgi:hypothetical protein